ncbi:MAG: hypothetical protein ACRDZY_05980 [Acidimicrobiales bacterium]
MNAPAADRDQPGPQWGEGSALVLDVNTGRSLQFDAERQVGLWHQLPGGQPTRRDVLPPLTRAEAAQTEVLLQSLLEAKRRGFKQYARLMDNTNHAHDWQDQSELVMVRERGGRIEALAIRGPCEARAYRVPPGRTILGGASELDGDLLALLDLIDAGRWESPCSPLSPPPVSQVPWDGT